MTRQEFISRLEMAVAAGVIRYEQTLTHPGSHSMYVLSNRELVELSNRLLEENNVLTDTAIQLSGSSC